MPIDISRDPSPRAIGAAFDDMLSYAFGDACKGKPGLKKENFCQSFEGFCNSSMIWSTVKLAARWLGGNSLKVARKFAT